MTKHERSIVIFRNLKQFTPLCLRQFIVLVWQHHIFNNHQMFCKYEIWFITYSMQTIYCQIWKKHNMVAYVPDKRHGKEKLQSFANYWCDWPLISNNAVHIRAYKASWDVCIWSVRCWVSLTVIPNQNLQSYFIGNLRHYGVHIDGLMQDCSISIAKALEILQSGTRPSTWCRCSEW